MTPFLFLLYATATVYGQNESGADVCCASKQDDGTCWSEILLNYPCYPVDENCAKICKGEIGKKYNKTERCGGTYYGLIKSGPIIRVPKFILPLNVNQTAGTRRLLGLWDDFSNFFSESHIVGIARTIPFVGPAIAFITPEYDRNKGVEVVEKLEEVTSLVAQVSAGVAENAALIKKERELSIMADDFLAQSIREATDFSKRIQQSLISGLSATYRSLAELSLGQSITRQEAAMSAMLANNIELYRISGSSEQAQKVLQLRTLGVYDDRIAIREEESSISFYVTSWMHSWIRTESGGFISYGVFGRVTVYRRPSALSFYLEGDHDIYDFKFEPIAKGQNIRTEACNLAQVQLCIDEYLQECVDDEECYYTDMPKYNNETYTYSSGPFNGQDNPGILGPECNGSLNPFCCAARDGEGWDGEICANECGVGKNLCEMEQSIVGARLTTIWLSSNDPMSDQVPFIEKIAGAKPLVSMSSTYNFSTSFQPTFVPYKATYFDPLSVGKVLLSTMATSTPQSMGELAKDLFESGNRKRNLVFARYGDFVEVEVGLQGIEHVIKTEEFFGYSSSILQFNSGIDPLSGWFPNDGCNYDNETEGMCCRNVAYGPIVSSMRYIEENLNITAQVKIIPLQISNINNELEIIREDVAELKLINNSEVENRLSGLEKVRNESELLVKRAEMVIASQEVIRSEITKILMDLEALKVREVASTVGVIALVMAGTAILCVCAIIGFVLKRVLSTPRAVSMF